MKRLEEYFGNAKKCIELRRKIGFEIEVLFKSNNSSRVYTLDTSQAIMRCLANEFSWIIEQITNNKIVRVRKGTDILCYDLGYNLFELNTLAVPVIEKSGLYKHAFLHLDDLFSAAKINNAEPINFHYDYMDDMNTLILPDKRDEIWIEMDGKALYRIAHICAIHINIDLCSIEEGMKFISILNEFYKIKGWPKTESKEIWNYYIKNSNANYEDYRFGNPPHDFNDYCRLLSETKVVMNKINNELKIIQPGIAFKNLENTDIDLFLRSVWWNSRLRVRGGNLVLEIRAIPSCSDFEIIRTRIENVLECLKI